MKECPNCGSEPPAGAAECPKCHFQLAKWKAGSFGGAAPPGPVPAPARRAEAEEGPPVSAETLALFAVFLTLAGYYYFKSRAPAAAPATAAAPAQDLSGAGGAVPEPCVLEGQVVDVYSLAPVIGARIVFKPRFAAVSDGDGKYLAKVQGGGDGYSAQFAHGDYLPGHVDGFSREWSDAPWDQRVRAARSVAADPEGGSARHDEYRCEPGQRKVYNFALVPKAVSDEDKTRIDAVP